MPPRSPVYGGGSSNRAAEISYVRGLRSSAPAPEPTDNVAATDARLAAARSRRQSLFCERQRYKEKLQQEAVWRASRADASRQASHDERQQRIAECTLRERARAEVPPSLY